MTEKINIRIAPDGTITAETKGIVGKKCTDYISILEDLLDSETVESEYTNDYFVSEINQNEFTEVENGTI